MIRAAMWLVQTIASRARALSPLVEVVKSIRLPLVKMNARRLRAAFSLAEAVKWRT